MALKKCRECGNEVSNKAESCPKCGVPIKKKASALSGCLTVIGLLFILGLLGSIFGDGDGRKVSNGVVHKKVRPAAQEVSLRSLVGQYTDNEIRADSMFKGRWIRTTGFVDDVKRDILNNIFVTIGTGAEFEVRQVQCFFEDDVADQVSRLSNGMSITVEGRVEGLMMNVLVKDCVLIQ